MSSLASCGSRSRQHGRLGLVHVLVFLTCTWTLCVVSTVFAQPSEEVAVDPDLREQAVGILQNTMRNEPRWSKVHAAEYLLALDYLDGVHEAFVNELAAHQQEPEYRIGIWRVLARVADSDTERSRWIERIREVASDPAAKDRFHAITALAKLGRPVSEDEVADDIRQASREQLVAYLAERTGKRALQATQMLAQIGGHRDVALLKDALASADPDIRSAAASAILRIDRRQSHYLAPWDWLVIAVYLAGMLSVGWYYSRRTRTREEYLLGGRTMRPLGVGVSLFASLISTISYLAWPGEIIKNGPMMLSSLLACPLNALIVGWFMIPFIMRLKVTSAYEILELRLGVGVRMVGSTLFLSLRFLWMSVILYATTSKVLIPLLGLDPRTAPLVCILLGTITVVYTTMGGLRAVVLTDVIQSCILFGGAIATLVVITISLGGVGAWWPDHWASHWQIPVYGYDPTARVTVFGAVLASVTWSVCTSGSDQIAIQRYLATRNAKTARTVLNISLVADVLVALLLAGVGFGLLAFYRARPFLLPDTQTILSDADKLFPRFIVVGLPVGVSGLVVAGLLAAAMSALSAGINSTCSVITVDFLDRFRKQRDAQTESTHVRQVKWVSVLVGGIVVSLSLFINQVHGNLLEIAYKVVNLFTAPLFGLFFMAMFVRWATGFGTLVGAACGLATAIGVSYWPELTGMPGISFLWAMPLSLAVEVAVASMTSLVPIGRPAVSLEQVV